MSKKELLKVLAEENGPPPKLKKDDSGTLEEESEAESDNEPEVIEFVDPIKAIQRKRDAKRETQSQQARLTAYRIFFQY